MPTYLFECLACRMVVSQIRSVSQRDDSIKCPKCEMIMFRRLDFAGTKFNGDGFYSTDKRRDQK